MRFIHRHGEEEERPEGEGDEAAKPPVFREPAPTDGEEPGRVRDQQLSEADLHLVSVRVR